MTTANLIMAVCLIVLMGVAVLFIIRYVRKSAELKAREASLDEKAAEIKRRQDLLIEQRQKLHADHESIRKDIDKRKAVYEKAKHIYANKSVDDPDDTAPEAPERSIYKTLVSQFGYSTGRFMKDHITRRHSEGKTIYSLDLNVFPYENE